MGTHIKISPTSGGSPSDVGVYKERQKQRRCSNENVENEWISNH